MCGISGFAYEDSSCVADQVMLVAMTNMIRHRGRDGQGFLAKPGVGLGFRRLSIIDLKTGDQPLFNEDKTVTVICNGEIYNYIELREDLIQKGHRFQSDSDVEVIVHLYEDHSTDCLNFLRGMFAFALWDAREEWLFLARDRLGIKPLNYAIGRDRSIYFGSEIKSILASGCIARELEPQAVKDLFQFGFVLSPKTLFKGIKRLLPGHYLLYQKGEIKLRKYWDLKFPESTEERPRLTETEWSEAVKEKFEETIRIHLRSDVPVSGWLSAGIDSSAVVAFMQYLSSSTIRTFTMAFEDDRADEFSTNKTLDQYADFEVSNIRLACHAEDFDLYPKCVWHEENPDVSGLHLLQMILSQETSRNMKVVLTGEGADEIFGGYPWYRFDKLSRPFSCVPAGIRRLMLLGPVMPKLKPWASQVFLADRPIHLKSYADLISLQYPGLLNTVVSPELREVILKNDRETKFLKGRTDLMRLHPFERIQYLETKTRLLDWIVHGLDRVSMAYSLEARVPFLDHELVELACQIPPSLKMKRIREKYIFRKAMKGHLPKEILKRKKFGFRAPTSRWLRGKLPDFAEAMFSPGALRKTGYFNPEVVSQLLSKHVRGDRDFTKPLMVVLGVQLWHQLFIDSFQRDV